MSTVVVVWMIGMINLNHGLRIPLYFHKVNKSFLSYCLTTLIHVSKNKMITINRMVQLLLMGYVVNG